MRTRAAWPLALAILTAVPPPATAADTPDDVVRAVRDAFQHRRSDGDLARTLRRLSLKTRLDNRTAEEMESLAPGPKSIAELERLREITRDLPLPAVVPQFDSPPAPTPEELRRVIEAARGKALAYTAGLPDFICGETVRRYESATGKANWALTDTLTLQLTYFGHLENYKLTAMNGRKTELTYEGAGGMMSKGEFGSMLLEVFAPDSRVAFAWSNWTTLRHRPAYVLSFSIAAWNSRYFLMVGQRGTGSVSTEAGEHGLVYIDRETEEVLRVDSEADSIPDGFPLAGATRVLDYGETEVGGRSFLLPLRADLRMMPRDSQPQARNEVEFTGYRKFTGESAISFGDPVEEKPAAGHGKK
jgi:hypothetical protein